ncbi:hypothetical protein C6A85_08195, partial [Mycobacterium sp. ITM-2017-0098]
TRSVARQGLKVQRRIASVSAPTAKQVPRTAGQNSAWVNAIRRSTKRDEPAPATGGIHDGQVH